MASHSLTKELNEVHDQMLSRYKLYKQAQADIAKAKKMEQYLRTFKALGNQHDDKIMPDFQSELETQAMSAIAQDVGKVLGIGKYSLFRNEHQWYAKENNSSKKRWGADDVFEAELAALLDIALERASSGKISVEQSGANLIGDLSSNISSEYLKAVAEQGQSFINKTKVNSNLIDLPVFRSGKIDVEGYKANFDITANILPEWQEFISLFTGVKCTVKNYSSKSQYESIHLGKSNPIKSIIGELSQLNYGPDEAAHIYYHSLGSYQSSKSSKNKTHIGNHIYHLRFGYELSGEGLFDSQNNQLDAADFFIYNDPASNNIWVRSTKEMIANVIDYAGRVPGDPFTSGVVVLKQSFN